jgi:hypothetical protein
MSDEILEQMLRELPKSDLPESWRGEILSTAWRAAGAQNQQVWPTLLANLRHLCVRNPVTATAMAGLWILIFFFKAGTPVDSSESELLAHFDPNRPVYLVSIRDEIQLAELLQDQPDQRQYLQIP